MSEVSAVIEGPSKVQELGEKLAGGQYVALLLWVVGAFLVHFEWKEVAGLGAVVIPLTIALYRLGGSLDDLLFDPIFKPETDNHPLLRWLGFRMRAARRNAACLLQTGERDCVKTHRDLDDHEPRTKGIYSRSEGLYRGTREWKQRIEPRIKLSKAARCFVIPSALVFAYDYWPAFLPRLRAPNNLFGAFAFLAAPWAQWVSLVLCLSLIGLYVLLRLGHMQALYELVTRNADFQSGPLDLPDRGREETLSGNGCLFFISHRELKLIRRSAAHDQGYSTRLLLKGGTTTLSHSAGSKVP